MNEDSNPNKEASSSGCFTVVIGSVIAPIVLFIAAQTIYGSHRHDSSAGWNFAPLLPYLWPLKWLPVYWLTFVFVNALSHREPGAIPRSSASNSSAIAMIVYIIIALLARSFLGQGSFDFYG